MKPNYVSDMYLLADSPTIPIFLGPNFPISPQSRKSNDKIKKKNTRKQKQTKVGIDFVKPENKLM